MYTGRILMILSLFFSCQIHVQHAHYSMTYRVKRWFGVSPAEFLAQMKQDEKNRELQFYCFKEIPYARVGLFFHKAVPALFDPKKKKLKEIVYLIEHGASPNVDVPYHWWLKVAGIGSFRPLYLFIALNDLKSTQVLLEHGANIDEPILIKRVNQKACDWNHIYALDVACSDEMKALLISYGA